MTAQQALAAVLEGRRLSEAEAGGAFDDVMEGGVPPEVTAGLLCALAARRETVEELTGVARAMRARVARVHLPEGRVAVDVCGTGGDGRGTFNISTTVAFVVAGAGVVVAKHGNRAVSSRSGSADVLEALGVTVDAPVPTVEACLRNAGIGFLFAARLHPAMRHAAPVRKALGVRTLFNLVGPLTNPAFAPRQLLGVYAQDRIGDLAAVLGRLGCKRAWVVHGSDGLDELTLAGPSAVAEWRGGSVHRFDVSPEDAGLTRCAAGANAGGTPAENAAVLLSVLAGEVGPALDVVLLNAAAAFVVAGLDADLRAGVQRAREAIESSRARHALDAVIRESAL